MVVELEQVPKSENPELFCQSWSLSAGRLRIFSVAPWQLSRNPVVRLAKSKKGREGSQYGAKVQIYRVLNENVPHKKITRAKLKPHCRYLRSATFVFQNVRFVIQINSLFLTRLKKTSMMKTMKILMNTMNSSLTVEKVNKFLSYDRIL